jgi:hypothetical protein
LLLLAVAGVGTAGLGGQDGCTAAAQQQGKAAGLIAAATGQLGGLCHHCFKALLLETLLCGNFVYHCVP